MIELLILFVGGFVSYVIGFVTRDIIWRSRLKDNNLEFVGFDEKDYPIIVKR